MVDPAEPRFLRFRDAVRNRVGRNLRQLRQARGLSQEQLAELAGFSLQYVQRLEWARHSMPLDTLARLAFVLEVDPAALLAPDEK